MDKQVEQQRLLEVYLSNIEMIGEGFSGAFNARRRECIEDFRLTGLPRRGDENYLYSQVRELFPEQAEFYFTPPVWLEETVAQSGADERIVLCNGFSDGTLHRTPQGVVYGSLRAALNGGAQDGVGRYGSAADNKGCALAALNSAFMQDGAFVYVPRGVKAGRRIVIDCRFRTREQAQVCFGRCLVVADEDAEADIVLEYRVGAGVTADCVVEYRAERGARIRSIQSDEVERGGALLAMNYVSQCERSGVESVFADLGDGFSRVDFATDLAGREAESRLWGLYLAGGDDHTDLNVRVNHAVPDCRSYELVKGVVSGEATGAFSGLVYVAPDAQRTEAMQQCRNLQLSDGARVYARPHLEIYADDVKCSHGATVGQLDGEQVYYMRQRGIGEQEARRLQMRGFVNDILAHCTCERTCDRLRELADEKIERL